MEQITRKDGKYYYGIQPCKSAEETYQKFRAEYHKNLGKRVYRRLNRIGQREERVHEFGFCFAKESRHRDFEDYHGRVSTRLLGLVCGSYCRMFGAWDIPDCVGVEDFEDWFDWAFSAGGGHLRLVGKNLKSGRTSKMLKKRYR